MSIGLLCPGQGAQKVGMGVLWAERSPGARAIFDRANEALGYDLYALCAEGPADRLTRTDVCQPAILATSAACLAAGEEEGRLDRSQLGAALGLSLGEYTALYAAGVLALEDALKLVHLRGTAMQEASNEPPSGMTSILGATREEADEVCTAATAEGGVCVVANLNAPGQVVISGDKPALDRAEAIAAEKGFRRAIRLEVAGAFHSPLMEPARARLEEAIAGCAFQTAQFPVYGNVDASPDTDPDALRGKLIRQLTSPVLFADSIQRAMDDGVRSFVELSPGRVLTGLVKKVERKFPLTAAEGDWDQ
ncbi:MAG: ACP S-malonyltransferase [Planctomycetota bacterium]